MTLMVDINPLLLISLKSSDFKKMFCCVFGLSLLISWQSTEKRIIKFEYIARVIQTTTTTCHATDEHNEASYSEY